VALQESTVVFSVLDIENTKNAIKIGIVTTVIVGILIGGLYFVFENTIETNDIEWEGINGPISFDEYGDAEFYEEWCVSNNGVWFESAECKWEHRQDHYDAMDNLKFTKGVKILGEFAEKICYTMDIPCPENATFDASERIRTGEIVYTGYNLGKIFNFKIINEQLFYMQDGIHEDWSLVD